MLMKNTKNVLISVKKKLFTWKQIFFYENARWRIMKKWYWVNRCLRHFIELLRADLKAGRNVPVIVPSDCNWLCSSKNGSEEVEQCCDEMATCVCGTATGHYACLCPRGYFGSGLKGFCQRWSLCLISSESSKFIHLFVHLSIHLFNGKKPVTKILYSLWDEHNIKNLFKKKQFSASDHNFFN